MQWRALQHLPPETLLLPQVPTAITEMEISVKRVRAAAAFLPSPAHQSLLEHSLCLLESPAAGSRPWTAPLGPAESWDPAGS